MDDPTSNDREESVPLNNDNNGGVSMNNNSSNNHASRNNVQHETSSVLSTAASAMNNDNISNNHMQQHQPSSSTTTTNSPTSHQPVVGGRNDILHPKETTIAQQQQQSSCRQSMTYQNNLHPNLPFLVTHWLSQYTPPPPPSSSSSDLALGGVSSSTEMNNSKNNNNNTINEREAALHVIRQQATQLARAFQTLGAFGQSSLPTMINNASGSSGNDLALSAQGFGCRPTTYTDLSRKYSNLLSINNGHEQTTINNNDDDGGRRGTTGGTVTLLDALIRHHAGVSSSALSTTRINNNTKHHVLPWSLLIAAYERCVPTEEESRSLLADNTTNEKSASMSNSGRKSSKFFGTGRRVGGGEGGDYFMSSDSGPGTTMPLVDKERCDDSSIHAAHASRQQLSLRMEAIHQRKEMESMVLSLQQSIKKQEVATSRRSEIDMLEESVSELNNLRRIVAQLEARAKEMNSKYDLTTVKVREAKMEAKKTYSNWTCIQKQYDDACKLNGEYPSSIHQNILRLGMSNDARRRNLGYGALAHAPGKNKIGMSAILSRQYHGAPGGRHHVVSPTSSQTSLSVLKSRLSHAVTISSHLIYPVYCLKFDKTGRYFITGSDDQTAKVFHVGGGESHGASFNYGANARGAVLVCTLNGHAGVVTDIDVSADNALLATSSMDGDVRVWRLKDGCPVAILRGHKDGANMASWSKLTPFRLVTCGDDGLARMWDIRKAALKKCGDYYSWLNQVEGEESQQEDDNFESEDCAPALQMNPIQPLPAQEGLAPAAAAVGPGVIDGNIALVQFGETFSEFTSNNRIDKGVSLVAQLQHGPVLAPEESGLQGRVTRTTGKPVKVMCISRCPVGGHFATGSDDGIARVWSDDDDWQVERLDCKLSEFDLKDDMVPSTRQSSMKLKSTNAPSTERLLATLREHNNPVTDLQYSSAGDRIITASMKDGNVCIWSGFHHGPMHAKFSNVSHVCIKLSPVSQGGPSTANVHCDGVAWTCDDTKVITSQSSPTKEATITDIIPFSNMIYVWDSLSGQCLLGLMSTHSSLCSALAPHPHLPSVIATAGADGVVNVWDLDRGDCFFSHSNNLLHGPVESATSRGKRCGYLEVQFSPDGLNIVLSDEGGRVTILDTQVPTRLRTNTDSNSMTPWSSSTPSWMKEQYFANDYYELLYDSNGYCIERGSSQPPHLSPGGVRCTHEGVPYPEAMRDVYRELHGPLPLPQKDARWHRDDIRSQRTEVRLESGAVSRKYKKIQVKSPDFSQRCDSMAIITKGGKFVQHERKHLSLATSSSSRAAGGATGPSASSSANRQLSNRYEWRTEMPDSEDDSDDQDDEEYEGNGRMPGENSEEEEEEEEGNNSQRSGRGRGRSGGRRRRGESPALDDDSDTLRPARASSRQISQQAYHELHSDDELLEEMMSTHTRPSGRFVEDWNVTEHLFKMPRGEGLNARRDWLSRLSRHDGHKTYCPQVGDSVIYVPRAHYDTLKKFPVSGYSPPWTSWPTSYSWPVVRCKVTHVRYRFPYAMYYRSRSRDDKLRGVAAVFTLEITGVPSQPLGRTHPWPAPSFVSPGASRTRSSDSIKFEVTVFECNEEDFLIPEYLYSWRVKELERAIRRNGGNVNGLSVNVYYPPDDSDTEDADHSNFDGSLLQINESGEDEFHFVDSGYMALTLKWDVEEGSKDTNEVSYQSVWGVSLNNPSRAVPNAPTMGEEVRKAVRTALRTIERLEPSVREWFFDQVDTSIYTDYFEMIEVPMYLSLIQKRLRSNYYTNKLSVLADMELVKENCYKYNEDGNEMYELACQMYDQFESLINAIEEPIVEESADESMDEEEVPCPPISNNVANAAPPAARARGAAENGNSKESADSDGDDSHNSDSKVQSSISIRRPRRGKREEVKMSDAESDDNHEVAPRRTRRSAAAHNTEDESPSSRRTSARARSKPTYTEKDSDEGEESSVVDEIDDESMDEESSEEEGKASPRKGRKLPPRARSKPSYAEKDNSEDSEDNYSESSSEEESDGDVSSEEEVSNKKRKRGGRKAAGEPRTKRGRTKRGSSIYPDLPQWPSVTRRQITRVGAAVLGKLRELDTLEFFSAPVVESFPEVADNYLRIVKEPMDFRTIEQERMSNYDSIAELQEDLILTFRNCCEFNGEGTDYCNYSLDIWQKLNDIFDEVAKKNY